MLSFFGAERLSQPRKRKEHIMRKIVRDCPNIVLVITASSFYTGSAF